MPRIEPGPLGAKLETTSSLFFYRALALTVLLNAAVILIQNFAQRAKINLSAKMRRRKAATPDL